MKPIRIGCSTITHLGEIRLKADGTTYGYPLCQRAGGWFGGRPSYTDLPATCPECIRLEQQKRREA